MKRVRWWWRLWRARHWEWKAFVELQRDRDSRAWGIYDRARKHTHQIWMEPPRRKPGRSVSPGTVPIAPPSQL
jgi:hypothetical protein